jgi:hypothetical protein
VKPEQATQVRAVLVRGMLVQAAERRHAESVRENAVNPSVGAPGAASMPRTVSRTELGMSALIGRRPTSRTAIVP